VGRVLLVLDWPKARIDILSCVIDITLNFRFLNTIRQTFKAIQFRVDRQVVIAHNSFAFDTLVRMAKLLNVVLRRSEGHILILYQLHITFSLLKWDANHTATVVEQNLGTCLITTVLPCYQLTAVRSSLT
jgi:uncharacterized membrane protein